MLTSASMAGLIGLRLRRSGWKSLGVERLDVLDNSRGFGPFETPLVSGHDGLVAIHDLGHGVHHRFGDVGFVDHHNRTAGEPFPASVEVEPGGPDVRGAIDGVAPQTLL